MKKVAAILLLSFCAMALELRSAAAGLVVSLSGSPTAPVLGVTVDNGDVYTTSPFDNLMFFTAPNVNDIVVLLDGPLGPINPDIIRAPASGAYLNLLRLSSGNGTPFTLSQSSPYTSSSNNLFLQFGSLSGLQALDGKMLTMSLISGNGPAIASVKFNYNIAEVPEAGAWAMLGLVGVGACIVRSARRNR
jgi:hypothetical protein